MSQTTSGKTATTAVAMSGGVDSSVAACLIAREGRPVVGFSMQLTDGLAGVEQRYGRCCSPDDFADARQVADKMGFPHYIVDMQESFVEQVHQPFADDYADGRTPSPCVRCNTYMKFGTLLARARAVGAEAVSTGHYAILEHDPELDRTLLRCAADPDKDQSYFLFDLSEAQRRRARFPLGHLTKAEVRDLARELGLNVAEKAESMDLCFVARDEKYGDFLKRAGMADAAEPGEIVDDHGEVLGRHEGVSGFTVGQRRGLGVSSSDRLYVLQVDPTRNRVVVGSDDRLYRDRCIIERTRWIPFERPSGPIRAQVRIRSNHEGAPATLVDRGDGTAEIRFDDAQRAIAPGQAAVAYDGDLVLGGGWICRDASPAHGTNRR